MATLARLLTGLLTYGLGAVLLWLAGKGIILSDADQQWLKDSIPTAALALGGLLAIIAGVLWTRYIKPWWDRWTGKPAVLILFLLPLLGGCMAPAALRQGEALEGATWQAHLGNDQRIEQTWESVFVATRQADIDYAMQKAIDRVKVEVKTPAEIEEGIKAVVAAREKAMGDTQLVVAKMRSLVAVNQSEAAKAMRLRGAISEWMNVGMEMSAIPNIVNEAFGLIQSMGLKITCPGIQTPAIQPEPTAVPVPK